MNCLDVLKNLEKQNEMIDIKNPKIYDVLVFHYPCQDGLVSAWVGYYYYSLLFIIIIFFSSTLITINFTC